MIKNKKLQNGFSRKTKKNEKFACSFSIIPYKKSI